MPTRRTAKPVRSVASRQAGRSQPARSVSVPRSDTWRQRLEELAAFKKEHGHCCVSTLDKKHATLGYWVRTQRGRRRRGRLSQEQIGVLDELEFFWDGRRERNKVKWESMYRALAAYQRAHGHCQVPFSITDDFRLAHWAFMQRHARREGQLSAERVRRLDELGFPWDVQGEGEQMEQAKRESKWEKMLAVLVKYKIAHGNCDVPATWPPNPRLATWVSKQRACNTKGTLPSNRRKRLEVLGFRFSDEGIVRKSKEKPRTRSGPIGSSRRPAPAKPSTLCLIWRQIRQGRSRSK